MKLIAERMAASILGIVIHPDRLGPGNPAITGAGYDHIGELLVSDERMNVHDPVGAIVPGDVKHARILWPLTDSKFRMLLSHYSALEQLDERGPLKLPNFGAS